MNHDAPLEAVSTSGLTGILFFTALTAVHPGAGESNSLVDLSIQREKTTGYPTIQATGLKGVMRDTARRLWGLADNDPRITRLFGAAINGDGSSSGSFTISDARLLLLRVRSLAGLFAYVSCDQALLRFRREAERLAGMSQVPAVAPEWNRDQAKGFYPDNLTRPVLAATDSQVVLEDLLLGLTPDAGVSQWGASLETWVGADAYYLGQRLLIVHPDVFAHLSEVGLAVQHRNRLKTDGSKTVEAGGLFNQELLCEGTVMYSVLRLEPHRATGEIRNDLLQVCGQVWQVGANETTGKGFLQPRFVS